MKVLRSHGLGLHSVTIVREEYNQRRPKVYMAQLEDADGVPDGPRFAVRNLNPRAIQHVKVSPAATHRLLLPDINAAHRAPSQNNGEAPSPQYRQVQRVLETWRRPNVYRAMVGHGSLMLCPLANRNLSQ